MQQQRPTADATPTVTETTNAPASTRVASATSPKPDARDALTVGDTATGCGCTSDTFDFVNVTSPRPGSTKSGATSPAARVVRVATLETAPCSSSSKPPGAETYAAPVASLTGAPHAASSSKAKMSRRIVASMAESWVARCAAAAARRTTAKSAPSAAAKNVSSRSGGGGTVISMSSRV